MERRTCPVALSKEVKASSSEGHQHQLPVKVGGEVGKCEGGREKLCDFFFL